MVVSRPPVSSADIAEELEALLEAATVLVALTADSSHARGRSVPLNGAMTGSEGLTLWDMSSKRAGVKACPLREVLIDSCRGGAYPVGCAIKGGGSVGQA